MTKKQISLLKLAPFANVADLLSGQELISMTTNHSANKVYLLTVVAPADYRKHHPSGASFPKIKIDGTQTFVVYVLDELGYDRIEIPDQSWNYHFVQPLPHDELLLVGARSRYRGKNDFDRNGHVFDHGGKLKRSFLLGDGIQDVQTTADGQIWASYIDEGVGGNYGWKKPVGSSGLISWDYLGNKLYEYSPTGNLGPIFDCYALNIINNQEAWCYYYTDFPLVKISNGKIKESWESPISGSDGFTLFKDHILFRGGYNNHDRYFLYQFTDNQNMTLKRIYELVDENGKKIKKCMRTARGHIFYLVQDNKLYKVDMRTLA